MPEIVRIYVLLCEETFGLQALHEAYVRAHPRGGDREGEAEREGERTGEDERSRERYTLHHLRPFCSYLTLTSLAVIYRVV